MYTIKVAAQLTGVSEAALRAWERRYGIVQPRRTPSGYRMYDDVAIRRIAAMRRLIDDGWAAREAARRVREDTPVSGRTGPAPEENAAADPAAHLDVGVDTTPPYAADLTEAARLLDEVGVARILDRRFGGGAFEQVVDRWLMPAAEEIGRAWEHSVIDVGVEHLLSNAIMRRLAQAFDSASPSIGAPRIAVGLPAGCRHEIGALAFAVVGRRAGLRVAYLGPDLPAADWATAMRSARMDAAVLTVPKGADLIAAHAAVRAIEKASPETMIAVGGGAQEDLPPPAVSLGHQIAPAAVRLRQLLEPRRRGGPRRTPGAPR